MIESEAFGESVSHVAAVRILAFLVRPGVRCRYAVQHESSGKHFPAALPNQHPASCGLERAAFCVRSTGERQRYSGSAPKRTCFSSDPGSVLRLPACARGQGETSPCCLSLASKTISFPNRKEMGFALSSLSPANS